LEFAVFLFHIGRIRFVDLLALGVLFVLILAFKTAIPTAIVTGMSVILILAPTTRPLVSGNDLIFPLLIHTLIGNRIGWIELGGFAAAILASLSAAVALWYFVERSSHLRVRMIKVRGGVRVWEQQ
jgi:hypothetical protein